MVTYTAAVTCLATSVSYNFVVSGSKVSCSTRKVDISNADMVAALRSSILAEGKLEAEDVMFIL